MEELKFKSLWIDAPSWSDSILVDDFLIAIGKTKSNSVYHVAEVKLKMKGKIVRYTMKVLKSDLITAIRRESDQRIIPFTWNYRK